MASDLSSYKVTAGATSSDTTQNNMIQAIQNALNAIGDTTQMAFAAGLILDGTQIKQNGAIAGQGLVWNGSNFVPSGASGTNSTTVAGLGTGVAGKIGRIQIGNDQFADVVDLIYNSAAAKWISASTFWPIVMGTAGFSTASATYVPLTGALIGPPLSIRSYKSFYDAGLRPQLFCAGTLRASAATLASLELLIVDALDGDTAAGTTVGTVDPILTLSANTITYKSSGWQNPTGLASPASKTSALVLPFAKVVSASTFFLGEQITNGPSGLMGGFRWVA